LHLRHNGAAPLGLDVFLAGITQGLRRWAIFFRASGAG